jgi:cytochrome P450
MNAIPDSITAKLTPDLQMLLVLQKVRLHRPPSSISKTNKYPQDLRRKIAKIISEKDQIQPPHPTIFHTLLSSTLPPAEKSLPRLGDEAQLMIGAGLETTAWALTTTCYHLLSNPSTLHLLYTELCAAIPDPSSIPNSLQLEKLPYLSACVQEGIRLSYGVSARNPRINPDGEMRYSDWVIPRGTPVSMTIVDVHHDERFFPNSRDFVPERWLGNPRTEEGGNLGRYFVAFGKGARSCLGIK